MKICGIYKIISPNKCVYIGKSIDIVKRISCYNRCDCKNQNRIFNSIKKYGWKRHKFEILCQCDKDELDNLEKYYIQLYQSCNSKYGLNLTSGGDGWRDLSKEAIERISNSKRKKVTLYTIYGEYIRDFSCVTEAADFLKVNVSIISKCLKRTQKSLHGKYTLRYYNEKFVITDYRRIRIRDLYIDGVFIKKIKNSKELTKYFDICSALSAKIYRLGYDYKRKIKLVKPC